MTLIRFAGGQLQAEIPHVAHAIKRPFQRAWGDLSAGGQREVWLYPR